MLICCVGTASAATLHPGDKVSVTVYNHPELTTLTVLDSTGRVSLPIAGLVDAANLTPGQLALRIKNDLVRVVRKPAVEVQLVSQGQNIFVTGASSRVLTYSPGETIVAAIAQVQAAGATATVQAPGAPPDPAQPGAAGSLDLRRVVVKRDGKDLPVIDVMRLIASGDPGPALQPDDTIQLTEKPIAVTVRGDVKSPGVAHLDADEPISNALLQVGDANVATSSVLFILTRDGKEQTITTSTPAYRAPAQNGDSIYVPHGQRVGVVGQVNKPGEVLLQGDNTLLSALYYAGGPTSYGDIRYVGVIHNGVQGTYDVTKLTHGASPLNNPELSDGDTVFVPEGHKIDFKSFFQILLPARHLFGLP